MSMELHIDIEPGSILHTVMAERDAALEQVRDLHEGLRKESRRSDALANERDGLLEQVRVLTDVLREAEHSLHTVHGLWATDKPNEYEDALREGADGNGARDCQREVTWHIDELPVIQRIKDALAATKPTEEPV